MKTKFRKIIIAWSIVNIALVLVWVGGFFLINRQNDALASRRLPDRSSTLDSVELNLFDNSTKQNLAASYFVSSSSTVVFLEDLERLGREAGVDLSIGQAAEQVGELGLSLVVTADFGRLSRFLKGLELLPYAARVNRIELRRGEKGVWRGDFFLIVLKDNHGQ